MKQAPKLVHQGKKNLEEKEQFYLVPQRIADIVFYTLGNASAQLRIMLVLIGTKPDFCISQEWILQRAGIGESSYINARKALVKRGWLYHSDGEYIKVDFDAIREDGKKMDAQRAKAKEKKIAEEPATIAGESKPATATGKDIPATIAGNEECGSKPATTAGKQPAIIEGNTPATIADITDKEQNKREQNNIMEKPQEAGPERKEVSESSLYTLLNSGNKVVWEDRKQGLFCFNGRYFKVIWNPRPAENEPATTAGGAEKKSMPLKRPEMPF